MFEEISYHMAIQETVKEYSTVEGEGPLLNFLGTWLGNL
jgi:hypothetical protein